MFENIASYNMIMQSLLKRFLSSGGKNVFFLLIQS